MDCAIHPGVDAPYQCHRCKEWICPDCEVKVEGRSMCRSCYANVHRQVAARYQAETRNINYPMGLLAAAAAAVAVAYVAARVDAAVSYRLPFAVTLLGGVVGYSVVSGSGGKRGESLQKLAAVVTLVGAFVAWLLASAFMGAPDRYGASGFEAPLAAALSTFPSYLQQDLKALDWVFLIVGVAWAWWIPHARTIPE
jgi:hypothetical protein